MHHQITFIPYLKLEHILVSIAKVTQSIVIIMRFFPGSTQNEIKAFHIVVKQLAGTTKETIRRKTNPLCIYIIPTPNATTHQVPYRVKHRTSEYCIPEKCQTPNPSCPQRTF